MTVLRWFVAKDEEEAGGSGFRSAEFKAPGEPGAPRAFFLGGGVTLLLSNNFKSFCRCGIFFKLIN